MDRVKVPKHDATFSFRAFRERLDKIKPRRQPRGRFRDFRHSEGESKNNLGKYKFLSDLQVKERRKELETQFRNAVIEVENYEGLNQGKDGACTLVSLIHMIWLSGASSKMFSRDISYVLRYWRSYWKPETTDSTHADASPDIASTIDMSLRTGLIKDASFLNYVPIRSEGNREQSFNESFWVRDRDMLVSRYNIKKVSDYDKITFVYQNAYVVARAFSPTHTSTHTPIGTWWKDSWTADIRLRLMHWNTPVLRLDTTRHIYCLPTVGTRNITNRTVPVRTSRMRDSALWTSG